MQAINRKGKLIETYCLILIDLLCVVLAYLTALVLRFHTVSAALFSNPLHYTVGFFQIYMYVPALRPLL